MHPAQEALKDLAEHYRRSLDIKVVGISGSVGKTSTKEMIASVLSEKYCVLKTEGNFNNEIGLPLTVFNLRKEHEVAVLEMGISHFGDMEPLAKIARPDVCVITNIGYAHLENLGTRDGILKEKTSMFDFMNPDGTVILNGDDDKLRGYTSKRGIQPVLLRTRPDLPVPCRTDSENGTERNSCHIRDTFFQFFRPRFHPRRSHDLQCTCRSCRRLCTWNERRREIIRGIEKLVPIAGRNNLIEAEHYTIIDDCYNANPASMKSSLDVLAFADTRTVAILGDMGELGADEKKMHAEVGSYAVKRASAFSSASELFPQKWRMPPGQLLKHLLIPTPKLSYIILIQKEAFYRQMDQLLKEQDTVLVKASHFMEFPEIVKRLQVQ